MIRGTVLIGTREVEGADRFSAINPATGETLDPVFHGAGPAEAGEAAGLAAAAFDSYRETDPETRARFLEAIAEKILATGDALIERAVAETGLPRARIEGERGRTVGQLRLFAANLRRGDWAQVTIDPALPDRQPLPRPDLRLRNVPLGPVAVFGASNFPLAFSVAGGDTASALAAGCPVIVKGHPAHPGTGELVARAIAAAIAEQGLHEGVFSYLPGPSNALGGALVADPRVKAVGFTGSRGGGLALMDIAQRRPEPIPVYAEMSSINPVILFPRALAAQPEELAQGFVGSLTMGAGQFCTNPGIVLGIGGSDLDRFIAGVAAVLTKSKPSVMLTPAICANYETGVERLSAHDAVELVARGSVGEGVNEGRAALFVTDAEPFLGDPALSHEVFGSSSIVVRCRDFGEVGEILESLEGQLTATLRLADGDEQLAAPLIPVLERKVGRILANGWPTGVEVTHAMVHGGPFPATSDSRTTSVGSLAIDRFLRPVSYQDLPESLLPPMLRDSNPYGLPRRVDGNLAS
ncbi:aldehyde dehydrogenase (NADP(+)) [Sphingosinicella sp. CPCC 101087]|uniref:aldehyde dehydrogenase (NADP(+)) n=1 Tax=Sphingosinicella sp. CPCC 101087 TaxID=2497754 RepID=UPI00101CB5BA|nr:aldehyde dehydrogenase (NADP(+)) [Sphingosinicella sp. CPCC 101087]